jgi:hypothetical protein
MEDAVQRNKDVYFVASQWAAKRYSIVALLMLRRIVRESTNPTCVNPENNSKTLVLEQEVAARRLLFQHVWASNDLLTDGYIWKNGESKRWFDALVVLYSLSRQMWDQSAFEMFCGTIRCVIRAALNLTNENDQTKAMLRMQGMIPFKIIKLLHDDTGEEEELV